MNIKKNVTFSMLTMKETESSWFIQLYMIKKVFLPL